VMSFSRWAGRSALLGALISGLLVPAQNPRAAYREEYRLWRTADPMLERDAAAGSNAMVGRAEKSAAAAARYTTARKAFLEAWSAAMNANAATLDNATGAAGIESTKALTTGYRDMVTAQGESLARTVDTFKRDPDPGIQKLRQAMEKEQSALAALGESIG